jgi:hypothetical protein
MYRLYKPDLEHNLLFIYLLKTIIMNKIVLESAKGVKGNKVQLTFSQVVSTGKSSNNILGLLNASDDRFNQAKPRFAWLSGEKADITAQFNIDVTNLAEGEELIINQEDPRLAGAPDMPLNIQIVETTKGTEYDVANFETRAKRAGKDGNFILHNGLYIYSRSLVVTGEAKHVILEGTTRLDVAQAADAVASALN